MIERLLTPIVLESLSWNPAVAILGPRQAGKTTLALEISKQLPSIYLDMVHIPDQTGRLVQAKLDGQSTAN